MHPFTSVFSKFLLPTFCQHVISWKTTVDNPKTTDNIVFSYMAQVSTKLEQNIDNNRFPMPKNAIVDNTKTTYDKEFIYAA